MSDLREYEYEENGHTVTAMLTEDDAKRLDAKPVGEAKSAHPADKSRTADNKDR